MSIDEYGRAGGKPGTVSFPLMHDSDLVSLDLAGYLDRVLENLADYTERQFESRRNVELALLYPVMLSLLAFGIVWATLIGFNRYGDALPDHSVIDMTPATRTPCRRIRTRCTVLADGRVLACDQDYAAARPIGSVREKTLAELWTGPAMSALREQHACGRFEDDSLCAACTEWHRP